MVAAGSYCWVHCGSIEYIQILDLNRVVADRRKIAQLKEGERRVLSGSGRTMLSGGHRGKVWEFPESNPRLDSEAHVHTGEEAIRWEDRKIKVGEDNDSHIIRAGRGPAPGPREAPTAHPDGEAHARGKLDGLGVNTGSEHLKWDDGLGSTEVRSAALPLPIALMPCPRPRGLAPPSTHRQPLILLFQGHSICCRYATYAA